MQQVLTMSEIETIDKSFLCDICGQEKTGNKFPVLDENYNKQRGLNQCEDCLKDGYFHIDQV